MGGCWIPGLQRHYFNCDICLHWYWPADTEIVNDYPECPIGRKLVEQYYESLNQPWSVRSTKHDVS